MSRKKFVVHLKFLFGRSFCVLEKHGFGCHSNFYTTKSNREVKIKQGIIFKFEDITIQEIFNFFFNEEFADIWFQELLFATF